MSKPLATISTWELRTELERQLASKRMLLLMGMSSVGDEQELQRDVDAISRALMKLGQFRQ